MKKIMFNDKYGLTQAVLEGRKTMTRRIATTEEIECPNIGWGIEGKERGKRALCSCNEILAMSRYAKDEVIAVAQAYKDAAYYLRHQDKYKEAAKREIYYMSAGWENKMFVKADLMPHRIKVTNIKVERLQDISEDDCLKEGIREGSNAGGSRSLTDYAQHGYTFGSAFDTENKLYETPREAFAALIDKVSGKGTWESNPYCFCYAFELID